MSGHEEDLVDRSDPLPNEGQRRQLCELLYAAFLELRCISHRPEQVQELAYALHNLPRTMYGWGTWSICGQRSVLARYRELYPEGGPDYAALLDGIFQNAE